MSNTAHTPVSRSRPDKRPPGLPPAGHPGRRPNPGSSSLPSPPPYNTINAQVIRGVNGTATIVSNGIGITYRAVADPAGSINTTSAGKGNFYDYMGSIIGATLPVDAGLPVPNPPGIIYHMPGSANVPQPMTVESNMNWFVAYGIPIFPTDDTGKPNQYPMMRLVATNTLGQVLASNDIVLPVSDEMNCRHNDILEQNGYNRTKCRACHGANYEGTPLSRAQADRTVSAGKFGSVTFWRGYQISCYRCHNGSDSSDPSSHGLPTANNVSATTAAGVPVAMTLTGSGGTGWRIVSQPSNGTVAITNHNLAVYFPGQGFAGTDTFTFAASNGYNDSATLGVGTVTVTNTYSLGDAIPDWWRLLHFGCTNCPEAAATADPDGDGMNNYQEFIAGTDPKDPRSRLRVFALQQSGGSALLSFESLLGNRYAVQYRDNLILGNWNSLSTNVWGRTDSTAFTDTNTAAHPQRFYRVLAQP